MNKFLILPCILIALIITLSHCSEKQVPKNIILFIGDGMGVGQISALLSEKKNTNFERLPVGGLIKTASADNYVTDSAAGATALSTGIKTNNKYLAISPDNDTLKTVVEYAEEMHKSTGLVVTCQMTHATPAAFAAHVNDRYLYNEIARQLAYSGIDVLVGGSLEYFIPQSHEGSKRNDELDLVSILQKKMPVVTSIEEYNMLGDIKKYAYLYAMQTPGRVAERPFSLKVLTEKAIETLSKNKNGFFLMVEGSQIDWGGHDNDIDYILSEMSDFDGALGAGLDFAKTNDETLILVTADHETGGLSLTDGKDPEISQKFDALFISKNHTGVMVPLFAYGPQAELFGGIHENSFIGEQIIRFNTN